MGGECMYVYVEMGGKGEDEISGVCGMASSGFRGEMWLDGDVYNVKWL